MCASSSLIPAVNKLGSMPIILGASDELKKKYLPQHRLGRGHDLLRPVRAGGGLGHRVDAVQGDSPTAIVTC